MIQFACPTCKTALQSATAGVAILCPKCQTKMQVPQAPSMVSARPPSVPPPSLPPARPAAPPVPPPPVAEWYISKNGQQHGPIAVEQLRAIANPSDLVWKQGMPSWTAAATVPNLLPAASVAPPPIPSVNQAPPSIPSVVGSGASDKVMPGHPPKDPILMAVLSVLVPWLGQLLIGQTVKAIVMFFVTPILVGLFVVATLGMGLAVLPLVYLIAGIDAYLLARKLKEGRPIGVWEFFGLESAPTLAMANPPLSAPTTSDKPARFVKPRPPGMVGSAIGMLFVSGLAMMITLLGVIGIVFNEGLSAITQILIALSFIHNAWVIFAVLQMIRLQRYAFAITAPLLVMASWIWLTFSGIPIGLSLMGILGGISVGLWSLSVLRQPEVRDVFENKYDPLVTLLPMAQSALQGGSPHVAALQGLFKQLLKNKIALGIAGVFLLLLLLIPLLRPSSKKQAGPWAPPAVGNSFAGDLDDDTPTPRTRKPRNRGGSGRDSEPDDNRPASGKPRRKDAYGEGYRIGHEAAKNVVDLARLSGQPISREDREQLKEAAELYKETCATSLKVSPGSQEAQDAARGYYDGMKNALDGK